MSMKFIIRIITLSKTESIGLEIKIFIRLCCMRDQNKEN